MTDLADRLQDAIDGYEIERVIGEGGMAVVFLARDVKHDRHVALKAMKSTNDAALGSERFLREIDIAAKLSHPHVLPLYDSGQAGGVHYFVMPYVEGESLRGLLSRRGPLPVDEAVRITGEIASALTYAHEQGLVHRDVKPENVLMQSGHAVVADFGIARAVSEQPEARLTGTGVAIGTLAYMSPEQASGDTEIDTRTDVYSLGCVVYEMLEGEPPFANAPPHVVLAKKVTGHPPKFSEDRSVPLTVASVVETALARVPENRHATPAVLANELRTASTTEAIEIAAARRRAARRLRALGAVAGVVLLGAAGVALTSWLSGPAIERVALLPFDHDGVDPTDEIFVQGMHRSLISEMQQAGLVVVSQRSVAQFGGDDTTPIRDIASELGVDAVIEGTAFRDADSVGIRITLTDGVTQTNLWSSEFGTPARDVIRLYRNVAAAVAHEIGFSLTPEAVARLAGAPPVDPEAYEAYLNGMYHWYRLTPQDLELAQRYFERALDIDPNYALAHAGMGQLWGGLQQMGLLEPAVAGPLSRTAVRRALALDSLLPEVQFAAAASQTWVDWDFRAADARFQRAIQLNDRYAEARAYYAHLLIFLQRPEEAVEQATFAIELDPLNTLIGALGCVTLAHVGAAEDALTQCSEVLRLDPTQPVAFDGRLMALRRLGRFEEFVADDAARARALGSPQLADAVEQGFADGGFQLAMRRMAETLEAQAERGEYVPPSLMASVLIDAGDVEAALDWLERGEQARDPSMPYLAAASSAVTAGLHDHPRYLALRERMGLAQGGG